MTASITPKCLSMWSGPRNISTAMMRAFGNRADCHPVDEPFYAYYLTKTGLQHPMREEVIASQPNDWKEAAAQFSQPLTDGQSLLYLKHMTQHILPEIDKASLQDHTHCFLIRHPRLVIASFAEKWSDVTAEATGFKQQLILYKYFKEQGASVCVIEGEDIQKSPRTMLDLLCKSCDIPFDENMLSWPTGRHPEDGVWGKHWYNAVEKSSGFAPYIEKEVSLSPALERLAEELEPFYDELKQQKIRH
ncbi:MAG: hypothetical protein V7750_14400 [Sneathiella sp.]